jgi:hypothetical protein
MRLHRARFQRWTVGTIAAIAPSPPPSTPPPLARFAIRAKLFSLLRGRTTLRFLRRYETFALGEFFGSGFTLEVLCRRVLFAGLTVTATTTASSTTSPAASSSTLAAIATLLLGTLLRFAAMRFFVKLLMNFNFGFDLVFLANFGRNRIR